MPASSLPDGERCQYATTIAVEVGLHHASPPPSNCGYWPVWISCEKRGTASSIPSAPPGGLGTYAFAFGMSEATAPTEDTVGAADEPGSR